MLTDLAPTKQPKTYLSIHLGLAVLTSLLVGGSGMWWIGQTQLGEGRTITTEASCPTSETNIQAPLSLALSAANLNCPTQDILSLLDNEYYQAKQFELKRTPDTVEISYMSPAFDERESLRNQITLPILPQTDISMNGDIEGDFYVRGDGFLITFEAMPEASRSDWYQNKPNVVTLTNNQFETGKIIYRLPPSEDELNNEYSKYYYSDYYSEACENVEPRPLACGGHTIAADYADENESSPVWIRVKCIVSTDHKDAVTQCDEMVSKMDLDAELIAR